MSDGDVAVGSEPDVLDETFDAQEAVGVAAVDLRPIELALDESTVLDRQTLDELDDQERAEVERVSGELRAELDADARAIPLVRLSKNFVLAEFHCCRAHCTREYVPGAAIPALRRLITEVLQPMRDEFGLCAVYSGYRNERHNGHVGGASKSCHRYDERPKTPAADVAFARGNVDAWAAVARQRLGDTGGGIGKYHAQAFVHVDLGPFRNW